MFKDSYGNSVKIGSYFRAAFEHDYNSCNWGYIADWEVVEYKSSNGKKYIKFETITNKENGIPSLSFSVRSNSYNLNDYFIWAKLIDNPAKIVRNCTGINEWCKETNDKWEKLFDFDNFKDGLF